ncbi:uncharacterized protein LOC105846735 [Hydra vulgaris]|uniref:uncharacterized protein LOC105846735 n=1 Tax=Hydra vulgaris TaxID=6087 RepID=UPI001F5EC375|nr:uncharacterized protein LOC105846735 [Hydra vulgaris]
MINNIQEECKQHCGRLFKMSQQSERFNHQNNCQTPIPISTTLSTPSSQTTLTDIFALNSTSVITRDIDAVALHIIKQKMLQTTSNVIEFQTDGPRPLCFTSTPKAYKESKDATLRTVRKRQSQLNDYISTTCGGSIRSKINQTTTLLKSFNENEQEIILSNSNISKTKISTEEIISLKANMSSTYANMKILSRWLKTKNIICASNAQQRSLAKKWSCDDLIIEKAPFMVEKKESKGSFEIKELPCAYINNLHGHIINVLDRLESNNLLLNKKIKGNEIHIKIGGDHGGGSFKMCYQVVNVEKPNAKTNTTVFNIFEASDCKTNLKFSLSRFKSEIDLLQNTISREKQICVFLFGDYKFLCAIYGITGATVLNCLITSGRHPCLFCNITRQGMSTPIKDNIEMRSLETLDSHLEKYKIMVQIPSLPSYVIMLLTKGYLMCHLIRSEFQHYTSHLVRI